MPKTKKVDTSDSDSGPEDRNPVKKSKSSASGGAASSVSRIEGADASWGLDGNKRITIQNFKGKVYVNIREYYKTKDGEDAPTKKGVSLTIKQWEQIKAVITEVDEEIKKM